MAKPAERRFVKNNLMDYVDWANLKCLRITNRMINEMFILSANDLEYQMVIRGLFYRDFY